MNVEEMEKLYNESPAFKIYVDRNCHMYGWTKQQAFDDAIIKSYAQYIMNGEQPERAKAREAGYEIRTNCGC